MPKNSASDAIKLLKEKRSPQNFFHVYNRFNSRNKKLSDAHPDIDIFTTAIDDKLDENCYIVPSLGDAGDRIYGTL